MKFTFGKLLGCFAILAASLYFAGNASADTVTGYVAQGGACYGCSNGGSVGSGGFSTNPSDYTWNYSFNLDNTTGSLFNFSSATDADLYSFLTTDPSGTPNGNTVTNISGGDQNSSNEAVPQGNMYAPAGANGCTVTAHGTCGINNDVMLFKGSVYLQKGQTYDFTHDDGMYLYINTLGIPTEVISSGAPTSAALSSFYWGGDSGAYTYNLWYDEVNGAPAQFSSPNFAYTPEPSSLILLGTGFFCLAFLLFWRRTRTSVDPLTTI